MIPDQKVIIVGAGLAGLIAAHRFPQAQIIDAATPENKERHNALLRFRSPVIGQLTGIPFREVTVHKAIYIDGEFISQPRIDHCNMYSRKVTGGLSDRSIWNLATEKRWIAPADYYEQLVAKLANRITWSRPFDASFFQYLRRQDDHVNVISTAPFRANLAAAGMDLGIDPSFGKGTSIIVSRYKLSIPCDVFQTVYFPSPDFGTFRASITGDTLIVESVANGVLENADGEIETIEWNPAWDLDEVCAAFGIRRKQLIEDGEPTIQTKGKIVPLGRDERESMIWNLTHEAGIFSLGRFATWRNVLLDDLVSDMDVIERLMTSSSYQKAKEMFVK
ncbi:hypothetical protein vB_Pae_PS44_00069 [Pseudomonas phage vB_Pae_PS44]|uniref:Uncharacterized protein n=4 Tax=Pbunavirus TaxID=1198980 RepID=A0A649V4P7_9CAUD|nr:hypothetical protein AVT16_gp69 [Pseudomonas phage vB_Pae_PS44]AIW01623.1 hypothetical protein vB_Pae_PS44_00069 [Pseudomonas phage vB_Pae_PS44]QGJ86905.1 hypothetical protein SMS12_065 [Pseudomonas phage vB_PaeM_SMS12]QGJ86995.1 hypothetical protein SMS21_065 [Pseudomonas phage vB_PaeM_SMS21]QGJ87131.1 hypothetical protein SMS29_065 [Pseudomonas phage vB_PaeM_SMS29]